MANSNQGFGRGQGERRLERVEGPKVKQTYVLGRKKYSKDCTVRIEGIQTDSVKAITVIESVEKITGLNTVLAVVENDAVSYDVTLNSKEDATKLVQGVEIESTDYNCSLLFSDTTVVSFMKLPSFIEDKEIINRLVSKGIKIVSPIYRRAIPGTQVADGTRYMKCIFPPGFVALPWTMPFKVGSVTKYYRVVHNNQTKVCSLCLMPDHIQRDCPHYQCNGCGQQWHTMRKCKAEKCGMCHLLPLMCKCEEVGQNDGKGTVDVAEDNSDYGGDRRGGFHRRNEVNDERVGEEENREDFGDETDDRNCIYCGKFFCTCICIICRNTNEECTCPCLRCDHYPCECDDFCNLCSNEPCVCPCQDCNRYPCNCEDICSQQKKEEENDDDNEVIFKKPTDDENNNVSHNKISVDVIIHTENVGSSDTRKRKNPVSEEKIQCVTGVSGKPVIGQEIEGIFPCCDETTEGDDSSKKKRMGISSSSCGIKATGRGEDENVDMDIGDRENYKSHCDDTVLCDTQFTDDGVVDDLNNSLVCDETRSMDEGESDSNIGDTFKKENGKPFTALELRSGKKKNKRRKRRSALKVKPNVNVGKKVQNVQNGS